MKLRIYVDGSCSGNPGPGGWAAIINTESNVQNYGGNTIKTTNNRMELTAALNGLTIGYDICKNSKITSYTGIEIYSDSAYVVNSINDGWAQKWKNNKWKTTNGKEIKNSDLWFSLLNLLNSCDLNVSFIKIKGHGVDYFNKKSDCIARYYCQCAKIAATPDAGKESDSIGLCE